MIVLDAGILIALSDSGDSHHAAVGRFLEEADDERLAANTVTIAESIVRGALDDRAEGILEGYELLGLIPLDLYGESAGAIARVRAETRLRMPDAIVLYTAEREGAELATTDAAVARAAESRGLVPHLVG